MELNFRRESVIDLGDAIENSPESYSSIYKAKQRINIANKKEIYYLKKGNVTAFSAGTDKIIFNIFAPDIICLEKLRGLNIIDHFRCVIGSEIHTLNVDSALVLINNGQLWDRVYDILIGYLRIYHSRDVKLSQASARDTVIHYLKYVWRLDVKQRNETSIYTYILDRTHISRSLIHKVLSDLEKEGLLKMNRGVIEYFSLTD